MNRTVAGSAWRIFDLEHELGIGGHNDGYSCLKCWRLEDETGKPLQDYQPAKRRHDRTMNGNSLLYVLLCIVVVILIVWMFTALLT